jgi:hypothetical protein
VLSESQHQAKAVSTLRFATALQMTPRVYDDKSGYNLRKMNWWKK